MTQCAVLMDPVELRRNNRLYISWPISGQSDAAVAAVSLEGSSTWNAMIIADGYAGAWFVGPDLSPPGSAVVVPVTSHCEIRVTDGLTVLTFDAGFIQLV